MQLKQKIIFLMTECLFSPGEVIIKENYNDDCSLYYLVKGEVEILNLSSNKNRDDSMIQRLQKESYFGEVSFITGFQRSQTVRAIDFCRVYKINRMEFLTLISENNQDSEEFSMIKENLIFKKNYRDLNQKCYLCSSEEHYSDKCPKTHLIISKKGIANRYSFSIPHLKRSDFNRNLLRNWKTLLFQKRTFQAVYQVNDNEELFDYLNEIEQKSKVDKSNQECEDSDDEINLENEWPEDNTEQYTNKEEEYSNDVFINKNQIRKCGTKKVMLQLRRSSEHSNHQIYNISSSKNLIEKNDFNFIEFNEINNFNGKQSDESNTHETFQDTNFGNSLVFKQLEKNIKQIKKKQTSNDQIISFKEIVEEPSINYIAVSSGKQISSDKSIRKKQKSLTVCENNNNNSYSFINQDINKQQPSNFHSSKLILHQNESINENTTLLNQLLQSNALIQQLLSQFSNQNQQILSKQKQQIDPIKKKRQKFATSSNTKFDDQKETCFVFNQTKISGSMSQSELNYHTQVETMSPIAKMRDKKKKTMIENRMQASSYARQKTILFNPKLYQNQINQDNIRDESYFMLQRFDRAHIFKYYYPKYNYPQIIKIIKKRQNPQQTDLKLIKKMRSLIPIHKKIQLLSLG